MSEGTICSCGRHYQQNMHWTNMQKRLDSHSHFVTKGASWGDLIFETNMHHVPIFSCFIKSSIIIIFNVVSFGHLPLFVEWDSTKLMGERGCRDQLSKPNQPPRGVNASTENRTRVGRIPSKMCMVSYPLHYGRCTIKSLILQTRQDIFMKE